MQGEVQTTYLLIRSSTMQELQKPTCNSHDQNMTHHLRLD